MVCDCTLHNNTSEKNWPWWRVVWDFTLHNPIHQKRNFLDEGWCATVHYITIHQKRIDHDEGWCEILHYMTIHQKRIFLDEGWCVTVHYITIHQKRIDLDEGWCATLHYTTQCIRKDWPWWRVVWDFIIHNNTSEKKWPWWRVVCDFTLHNNTHYITIHQKRIDIDEGRCETKGSGDEGRWWQSEVATLGSGDEGSVVTLWSGDYREVLTKGSVDEGNAEKRIVMAAWMLNGLCFGEEAGARNLVFFRVKWLQPAMKGTSCVRRVLLRSFLPRIGSSSVCCNEWLRLCA